MRTFHNATHEALIFELRDARYHVPAGANVLIDDDLDWIVRARGLRLANGASADKEAPTVAPERIRHHPPVLQRGVELGEVRRRAREENEDPEAGDGPPLAGDDEDADGEDPIAKAAAQLEAQGINLEALGGGGAGRQRRRR